MIPNEAGRNWPDSVLLTTMDRVFDAALPALSAGATDKDRLAEISIVLSRTLVELTSEGVTAYTDLLKLTLETFPLVANGSAAVRT